ncbi:Elongation of very long chain fatty acids protein AAEL008004 [Eumeta japonica]|uniref:Elongation of very long chain fatty acids protein n=1 Tax=Eumeta variegata TaxID=151549 RepID=A0A4C1Y5G0_EUMVA|nr:Elongation of very long chain fatty acids protein AAEL008004 [Eumeta japonica]
MLGLINSGVHTVMYSYYLISAVRPLWIRPWWKKYITQLQILQFLVLFIHFGHALLDTECEYPKWICMQCSREDQDRHLSRVQDWIELDSIESQPESRVGQEFEFWLTTWSVNRIRQRNSI